MRICADEDLASIIPDLPDENGNHDSSGAYDTQINPETICLVDDDAKNIQR